MSHRHYLLGNARLLQALREANVRQDYRAARLHARNYFGTVAALYANAFLALDYRPGETVAQRTVRAEALAARVRPFEAYSGRVNWWREEKRSGGFRILCDLPHALRARQLMIRQVLSTQFKPGAHVFDIRGRGRDALARSVAAAMEEGFTHAYVADVRSCFPSVNPEALYSLPLPNQVIRYALDYRSLKFRHNSGKETESCLSLYGGISGTRRIGPSGLLQGSQTANLILAWLFNDMDQPLSSSCRLFLLSDDIIALGRSEGACLRTEHTLAEYLRLHQAGPFVLEGSVERIGDGFEKLGYRFHRSELTGEVTIDFSGANAEKIMRRVNAAIACDKAAGRMRGVEARAALERSMSGFRAITFWEGARLMFLEGIDDEITHHALGFGDPGW